MNRIAFALAVATPLAAHADAAQDAAAMFAKAQQRYEAGEYRAAIRLFEDGYKLVHDPVYLFNIAQSYRKLFDCIPAANYYQQYLSEAYDADQAQKDRVKAWLAELAPCVADHKSAAQFEARPNPDPQATPIRIEREHPGRVQRIGGLVLVGAGVAAAVVGGVYLRRANELEGELETACTAGCLWTDALEATERDAKQANTNAVISWAIGAAAIGGGVGLYLWGRSKRVAAERVVIIPVPTAAGAAVSARVTF